MADVIALQDGFKINVVIATCNSCQKSREFKLETPLRSAAEVNTWLPTLGQNRWCSCGPGTTANIQMRLDPVD